MRLRRFSLPSLAERLFPHPPHRQIFVQSLILKQMHRMVWMHVGFEGSAVAFAFNCSSCDFCDRTCFRLCRIIKYNIVNTFIK